MSTFLGTVTVIGGGVMGEAIARGWLQRDAVDAAKLAVVEPVARRREQLAAALPGVKVVATAREAVPADVVMLAVKPQVMESVLGELADLLSTSLVVSIAAGISCARLEASLPSGARVVRVMPNTPAMVGEGMAVVSGGGEATPEDVELVRGLFEALGKAVVIEERYQNAATAISGSGPAYFALVIDALARAGVGVGLPRQVAETLAVQTMSGTAKLLTETGQHPSSLMDGVSSPGGTTIAALSELEAAGLRAAFTDAVRAAVRRAEELG